jgi:hypothetical protein
MNNLEYAVARKNAGSWTCNHESPPVLVISVFPFVTLAVELSIMGKGKKPIALAVGQG